MDHEIPPFSPDDDVTADEISNVLNRFLTDLHVRTISAAAGDTFSRLTVWMPSGQRFAVQVTEL